MDRASGRDDRVRVWPPLWHALAAVGVLAAFAWQVQQHYFLGDDSFISFRYALHLSEGLGLVWNPGERVDCRQCNGAGTFRKVIYR